jgi:hypothetical protein
VNEGILDNDTIALIHDDNDEIDDMEETDDVVLGNEGKSLQVWVMLFQTLLLQMMSISKYLKIWQICTCDIKNCNKKSRQPNHIGWIFLNKLEIFFSIYE